MPMSLIMRMMSSDLLGIANVFRQVVVDLGVGQVTLLAPRRDQLFQAGLLLRF